MNGSMKTGSACCPRPRRRLKESVSPLQSCARFQWNMVVVMGTEEGVEGGEPQARVRNDGRTIVSEP